MPEHREPTFLTIDGNGAVGSAPRAWSSLEGMPGVEVAGLPDSANGGPIWAAIRYAPGIEVPFHHDPTEQWIVVTSGSIAITTEAGEAQLAVGDQLRLAPSVDHGWRVGAEPVELTVFAFVPDCGSGRASVSDDR